MAQVLGNKKKGNGRKAPLTLDKRKVLDNRLMTLASELVYRTQLADKLGKSYWQGGTNAQRDLYKTLGYELNPDFNSYYVRYKRQDIAKAIVEALPNACWRLKPEIVDSENQDSRFQTDLATIIKQKKVWSYLARADKVSGIGQYGGILIGFDDGQEMSQPVKKAKNLLYLRPYMQNNLTVKSIVEDTKNERYGLPELYDLDVHVGKDAQAQSKTTMTVHYSRLILLCEGLEDDDVLGTPRLECVLNRLQDLELISGGSAEMFWRGAFPGYAFTADSDAQFDTQTMEDLEDEIQDYMHELRRYLRLQGVNVEALQVEVADPSNHVDVLISLIAAATRIPKRILLGSERGELASSQDERAWVDRIEERRTSYVEPNIIRPFVDKLIEVGIIPEPTKGEYVVNWPPLIVLGEQEKMAIATAATEALAKYRATPGLTEMIPPEMYLKKFFSFTDEDIQMIKQFLGQDLEGDLTYESAEPEDEEEEPEEQEEEEPEEEEEDE